MKQNTKFIRSLLFVGCFLAIGAFGNKSYAQLEGGAIAAIEEPSDGGGGGSNSKPTIVKKSKTSNVKSKASFPTIRPKTVSARPKPKRWDGFVVGDEYTFMNFEVISAEKPYYTRDAKAGGASGLVQVEILIDTNGNVISARARTGNKLLHPEAERAAFASRLSRFTFGGKPARAIGFLVYRFGSNDPSARKKARPCFHDRNGFKSPLRQWTAIPFDSDEWLSGDRWLRARMRQDIFDTRIPNGKSRLEVSSWFGQPDAKKTIDGREVWFYNVNTGEADDIDMLAISFETKGKAFAGMSKNGTVSIGALCGKIFPLDSSDF